MKEKRVYIVLTMEAVFCFLLYTSKVETSVFSTIMAVPFEQIGIGLRFLSLQGSLWNALALTIYAAIGLIPIWYLLRKVQKRGFQYEDSFLLLVLSIFIFLVMYWMVNTDKITELFPIGGTFGDEIGKAILGCTVYSVLSAYLVIRILRLFFESKIEQLNQYLRILLGVLNVIFVWIIFGSCLDSLLESIKTLKAGNVGNEAELGVTYVILGLGFMVEALPYVLNIVTVFLALKLIDVMSTDGYSEDTVIIANKLSQWCAKALAVVMLSNVSLNLIQLVLAKKLRNMNSNLSIPVVSIAFVLAVLILARMIAENRKLKGDNDLFI